MILQRIQLQIFHVTVYIESQWAEVIELLKKDFWSYLSTDSPYAEGSTIALSLFRENTKPQFPIKVASLQTQNAINYDEGFTRFSDYYGSLYSIIDFEKNRAKIYSTDLEKMHEVAYLMILSRVGKILDLDGLHKLHAFAISIGEVALVCMMPSKGGKSTLLTELLKDPEVKMLSDDIPLVDSRGKLYPFLLKIGMDEIPADFQISNPDENVYQMKRAQYGTKQLVCTRGITEKLEIHDKQFEKIILLESFRVNSPVSSLRKVSFWKSFKGVFKHGIIGVGSPIIIEYFWEFGSKDFAVKTFIFLRRMIAFGFLCKRAKRYHLYAGTEPKKTAQDVLKLIRRLSHW